MSWVRTENGGMSDTDQQMSWQSILDWQVEMFFYSCYLYYVLDTPKLNDDGFDDIVKLLERHFDELPERITLTCGAGQIKPNAYLFAHDLSEEEKEKAVKWLKNELF